jgi:hypothetical protein
MPAVGDRLVNEVPPSEEVVQEWLGHKSYSHWQALENWINDNYPGVFRPDWTFGGAKHGWGLRYKRSKSFCTLVPEYQRTAVVIVFGAKEREKVAAILQELPSGVRRLYEAAETYHDGKWLKLSVPADATVTDIARLLTTKRRPSTSV